MKKTISMLLMLLVLLGLLPGCGSEIPVPEEKGLTMALILRGPEDANSLALAAGAQKAAAELGVELPDLTPSRRDSGLQAAQIRQAVAEQCKVLVVACEDAAEVRDALQEAAEAGVILIRVDTVPEAASQTVFSTDHRAAGKLAGETMLEMLEAKRIRSGVIGIIGVNQSDEAAQQREAGFREAFQGKHFAFVETRYDAKNPARAQNIAADYIERGACGIFGIGESGAVGAGNAVKESGARTVVVGFDQSAQIQHLLEEGVIRATLVQDHPAMGYEAVKAAAAALADGAASGEWTAMDTDVVRSETPFVHAADLQLALVVPDQLEHRWLTLEEGAVKAAEELGCELVNLSPAVGNEDLQIQQIQKAVEQGVDGIVAATDGSQNVAAALKKAGEAGLLVVEAGTSPGEQREAAGDQKAVGKLAGETMLEYLAARGVEKGDIGIIGVNENAEDALQRETGFREAFAGTAFNLLDTRYSEDDAAMAHVMAEEMILRQAKGIFASGTGSSIGAGNGAKARKSFKVVVIGYGDSAAIESLVEEGFLQAALVPQLNQAGYDAVQSACALLLGKEPEAPGQELGITLLTKTEE